jgi:hypothetical protein
MGSKTDGLSTRGSRGLIFLPGWLPRREQPDAGDSLAQIRTLPKFRVVS